MSTDPGVRAVGRALLAALLAALLTSPAWAPASQKPERLQIAELAEMVGLDFIIMTDHCQFGRATAGEKADFQIRTTLIITPPAAPVQSIGPVLTPVQIQPGATPDEFGFVPLIPIVLEWDGNGAGHPARIHLSAHAELLNPDGHVQATASFVGEIDVLP